MHTQKKDTNETSFRSLCKMAFFWRQERGLFRAVHVRLTWFLSGWSAPSVPFKIECLNTFFAETHWPLDGTAAVCGDCVGPNRDKEVEEDDAERAALQDAVCCLELLAQHAAPTHRIADLVVRASPPPAG